MCVAPGSVVDDDCCATTIWGASVDWVLWIALWQITVVVEKLKSARGKS
jgi:hypothetical protein